MILDFGYLFTELSLQVDALDGGKATMPAKQMRLRPGGRVLNQAVAAARMGAKVSLIGVVGDDLFGKDIVARLLREGITATGIARSKEPTGMITNIQDAQGKSICVASNGANSSLQTAQVPLMSLNAKALLLLQDDTPEKDNLALLRRARDGGAMSVVNLQSESQFAAVVEYADFIVARDDLALPDHPKLIRFKPEAKDQSFAEDCFTGALAACLQARMPLPQAVHHARVFADIAFRKADETDRFPYLDEVLKSMTMRESA